MAAPWERYQQQAGLMPVTGPKAPAPQTAAQAQGDILGNQVKAADLANAPAQARKAAADARKAEADAIKAEKEANPNANKDLEAVRLEALDKIKLARSLKDRSKNGWFTTGFGSALAAAPGGTAAYDVKADTETLKNAGALQRIMEMAQTNGGKNPLTPLSNSDFQALASSLSNLDTSQSDEQYQRNVQRVEDLYMRAYKGAGGTDLERDLSGGSDVSQLDKAALFAAAPAQPGAPPNAPLDPTGSGDIGFSGRVNDANSLPAGAQEFQRDLSYKIADGTLNTPEAIIVYGAQSKGNDGRGFVIDPQQAQAVLESVKKGGSFNVDTPAFPKPDISDVRGQGGVGEDIRAGIRGIPAFVGADDELNALIDGGDFRTSLARERAIRDYDEQNNFWPRLAGQALPTLALGFASMAPNAARAAALGAARTGIGRTAALQAGTRAFAGRAAVEGAGLGAVTGALSSDGSVGDRILSAGTSGVTGAALSYGLSRLGGRLLGPRSGPPGGGTGAQNAAYAARVNSAAAAEDIRVSRPLIDPTSRDKMMALEASMGGSGPIRAGLQETQDGIEAAAGRLTGPGTVEEVGSLGQRVQDAGSRYVTRSRGLGNRLYTRAAQMAGNATAKGQEAVLRLDAHIADLEQNANANAPLISYLKEIRADFADDAGNLMPKSVAAIRDLRTGLRGQISARNLRATDAERRIGDVLDGASIDLQRDLGATAPAAVRQFARADKFWKERASEIDQVVKRVIGSKDNPLSGEQVMAKMRAMAGPRGDSARHARMLAKLTPDERADYAATVADSLGRKAPDDAFEVGRFLKSTQGISDAAMRQIWGSEGLQSVKNLRVVGRALIDTKSRLNNSRSGAAMNWANVFRGLFTPSATIGGTLAGGLPGGVAGAAIGAGLTAGKVGATRLSAKALMNPDVSKWLAKATQATTRSEMRASTRALSNIIAREPALANELGQWEASLLRAINDNTPASAAASTGGDNEQRR